MTKSFLSLAVFAAGSLALMQPAQASITFNLTAGFFTDFAGANTTGGTLFQLVALGSNGIFDGINVADGSVNGLDRWASGDDVVISAVYQNSTDVFTTLAAFDHTSGNDSAGLLQRSWQFDIAEGTKFGVRWFPGLVAANFNGITLQEGQQYGQFTRQDDPLVAGPLYDGAKNNGALWVAPASGLITLDNLVTTAAGGTENNDLGRATLTVVPEPASLGLAMLGAIGILKLRRRRA